MLICILIHFPFSASFNPVSGVRIKFVNEALNKQERKKERVRKQFCQTDTDQEKVIKIEKQDNSTQYEADTLDKATFTEKEFQEKATQTTEYKKKVKHTIDFLRL